MKACAKCNLSYDDGKKFCKKCGETLTIIHKIEEIEIVKENLFEERIKADPLKIELSNEKLKKNKKIKRIILASFTGFIIIVVSIFVFKFFEEGKGIVKDIDGNKYHTVTIGTQVWMAENLKVTHYQNGESIQYIAAGDNWSNFNSGAYCENIAKIDAVKTYGLLYNWYAVNDERKLAPKGWHIPTDQDWTILLSITDRNNVGGELKETGYEHWASPNTEANNKTGFTALPGGYREDDRSYPQEGLTGVWWCSAENSIYNVSLKGVQHSSGSLLSKDKEVNKHLGLSVRCIRDN